MIESKEGKCVCPQIEDFEQPMKSESKKVIVKPSFLDQDSVENSSSDRCRISTTKSEHISDEGMIVFRAAIKSQDSFHRNTD